MKTAELINPNGWPLQKGCRSGFWGSDVTQKKKKKVVGEQQTFENNVLFSDSLLHFPPLTARTGNRTRTVYLPKRHLLSPFPSLGYSHITAFPSIRLSLRNHLASALIPSANRDTLCPHYLKHPCFLPRYTACAVFDDIRYMWFPVIQLPRESQA